MRLINCRADPLTQHEFEEDSAPPFAILSHTWGAEEVSYQHFTAEVRGRKAGQGWSKILKACAVTRSHGLDYVWVDSCCIDKTDSSELAESINSMFKWYNFATICIAFIEDYEGSGKYFKRLQHARWFTRGWTLQELIAPKEVHFYNKKWQHFGTRASLVDKLCSATAISTTILAPPKEANIRDLLDDVPVATRMKWASNRQTTKKEDIAYCLLGIFGVNMPLLYGEGSQAFIRLQEEIIRSTNDLTIFAWKAGEKQPHSSILASSPAEFAGVGTMVPMNDSKFDPDFSMTNKGLRIKARLYPHPNGHVIMPLSCHPRRRPGVLATQQVGIYLKHLGGSVYVRALPHNLAEVLRSDDPSSYSHIFLAKRVKSSTTAKTVAREDGDHPKDIYHHFSFQLDFAKVIQAEPEELWDPANQSFIIGGLSEFTGFVRVCPEDTADWEFVIACGRGSKRPWVSCGRVDGPLFLAARNGDLRRLAQVGQSQRIAQGSPGDEFEMYSVAGDVAVVDVSWHIKKLRGQLGIVIDTTVSLNSIAYSPGY